MRMRHKDVSICDNQNDTAVLSSHRAAVAAGKLTSAVPPVAQWKRRCSATTTDGLQKVKVAEGSLSIAAQADDSLTAACVKEHQFYVFHIHVSM